MVTLVCWNGIVGIRQVFRSRYYLGIVCFELGTVQHKRCTSYDILGVINYLSKVGRNLSWGCFSRNLIRQNYVAVFTRNKFDVTKKIYLSDGSRQKFCPTFYN